MLNGNVLFERKAINCFDSESMTFLRVLHSAGCAQSNALKLDGDALGQLLDRHAGARWLVLAKVLLVDTAAR